MNRPVAISFISYAFRVVLVWYVLSVLAELLFPGMISTVINLDFFLWAVILLALFSFVIARKKS